jgi:hypothetical protein
VQAKKKKNTQVERPDEGLHSPTAVPPVTCCPCSLFACTPVAFVLLKECFLLLTLFSSALDRFTVVLCFGKGNNDNNNDGDGDGKGKGKGKESGAKAIARVALVIQ